MQRLLQGIREFYRTGPSYSTKDIGKGQTPEVLLITCSDSRIVPHLVTNTGPGDIFVLRNAGNMLPEPGVGSSEEASIEYGIDVLEIPHLIVCGHTHCGAMKGLLSGVELPAVTEWLKASGDVRARAADRHDAESPLIAAIEENVLVQLERARRLPSVAKALERGKLALHGWVYDIEASTFRVYDDVTRVFSPLSEQLGRSA